MPRNSKHTVPHESIVSVGLDLSLTATGIVVLKDGEIMRQTVVKSKPMGDTPLDELIRIESIVSGIVQALEDLEPNIVCIEGLAFMARNTTALVQLSGLNYLVRQLLAENGWDFAMVAPSTLKKFITGKGNSDKNVMMMTVLKEYGHGFVDDNICDAFSLAAAGLALIGHPLKPMGVPQHEVAALLTKQIV